MPNGLPDESIAAELQNSDEDNHPKESDMSESESEYSQDSDKNYVAETSESALSNVSSTDKDEQPVVPI